MNKRPGQVRVTTEVGYCPFCNRSRNLRHEEHQLGNLVRTILTCESCFRTLSSTMGVAPAEAEAAPKPVAAEPAAKEETVETPPQPKSEPAKVNARRAPAKRAAAARKPAPAKPRSTAKTRKK